jgi:hypothetical protein
MDPNIMRRWHDPRYKGEELFVQINYEKLFAKI